MSRFHEVVIHPSHDDCPLYCGDAADCNGCEYCKHIGTLGGEYYVDCDANQREE